jgi:hypothetical protein
MRTTPDPSPVALFVALTRAVRDAGLQPEYRLRVYEVLDRLADAVGQPSFAVQVDALAALATREPSLHKVLNPYWTLLRALSTTSGALLRK